MSIENLLTRLNLSPRRSFEERFPRENYPTLYEDDDFLEHLEKIVDGTLRQEYAKYFPSRSSD